MGKKDLTLTDFINLIENDLGKSEWITVFEISDTDSENPSYFSAVIANSKVKDAEKKHEWDIRIGDGRPGFISYYKNGKPKTDYYRFSSKGIEPFIHYRTFSGKKVRVLEVSEEFRLYFNLFEKNLPNGNKALIFINDEGDEDQAVIIGENKVSVKLKYIKEYLAARKMHLAIYFELMKFSNEELAELGISKTDEVKKGEGFIYSICIRNLDFIGVSDSRKAQGWIIGKKLIGGAKNFKPSLFGDDGDKRYEKFIIGVDENGKEITASCNADDSKPPFYLTPVFFSREVLKKYYDSPERYTVDDGNVKREGFWGLRVLNNHPEHVVVWLGDLKYLPFKEQTHWRAFNITPSTRKISRADFTRNIEGNFADPEHPELYFKYKFGLFQKAWYEKFGWYLFKPLSSGDAHHLKSLHIPTTSEQKEFDDQIASITKIIIDSLNEEKLGENLKIEKKDPKSIDKLEFFLNSKGLSAPKMIEFIRNVQKLRSTGVAHRKGKNYDKAKEYFDIGKKDLPIVCEDILIDFIRFLNTLENKIIKN